MSLENLSTIETLGKTGLELRAKLEEELVSLSNQSPTCKPMVVGIIKNYDMDLSIIVQLSHLMVVTGVNEGQEITQLADAIGNRIGNYYNQKLKKSQSLNLGTFVLNGYALLNWVIIKMVNEAKKSQLGRTRDITVYKVYAANKGKLQQLKKEFDEKSDPYKPLTKQAPDWEYGTVKNGIGENIKLIKDASIDTLSKLNNINTPIVLNAVNKKQKIAYKVDERVFATYKWALKTNQPCFEHNSVDTIELARKIAKRREAEAVLDAAEPYVGKVFYQQYQCDNRGRLYPLSAYLNEINSDNAKGMLKFAEGSPLGNTGQEELFHHIANMWGEDKLTHEARVRFVRDNYERFVSYGRDPKANIGWMDAEEPFQFLNAVIELADFDAWADAGNKIEDFITHTICYRDGSNNGLQWLFSLAKDDDHAHLVNVKPTPDNKPGDMYTHVANKVIDMITEKVISEKEEAYENYEKYFKTIERLRNRWRKSELSDEQDVVDRKRKVVKWYQRRHKDKLKTTDLVYWKNANFDRKTWRKIVKRNVMTYGYSATKQGMGQQIIDDTRDIDNVYLSNKQHSAARLLGALVYEAIEQGFPLVSAVMKLFKDNCGEYMKTGNQYKHTTLISNFPFVQNYVKQTKNRVHIQNVYVTEADYKTKVRKTIAVMAKINTDKPNVIKAKAGISPNTIHNLDSLHLMLVINECNFDIVSAHDSYGCRAGDVQTMNKVIREQFKRIIDADPITHILNQHGNLVPMIERGNLDSSEILKSEFAFA